MAKRDVRAAAGAAKRLFTAHRRGGSQREYENKTRLERADGFNRRMDETGKRRRHLTIAEADAKAEA